MEKSNVIGFTGREETADALTELLKQIAWTAGSKPGLCWTDNAKILD